MQPLVSSAQMKEIENYTISSLGIPECVLMEHAAQAVFEALEERFSSQFRNTRGIIVAGTGNNGGDALAVARLVYSAGVQDLYVGIVGEESKLSVGARLQLGILGKLGVPVFWPKSCGSEIFNRGDWIVDGIFGTGLNRNVEEPSRQWIDSINQYANKKWIVAIDIPSGLSADQGQSLGTAVKASETVTLGFIKKGLVTARAADFVGRLRVASIQIPRLIPFPVDAFLYDATDAARLPIRRPSSHKGIFGNVSVWTSLPDRQGACILSALGALRSGVGLVRIIGEKNDIESLRSRLIPEIMTEVYTADYFSRNSGVLVIGPGLGEQTSRLGKILCEASNDRWKIVLDADALNILSTTPEILPKNINADRLVLTPHPKEASRLLGISVDQIEMDRFKAVRQLAEKFNATVVLKGKGSLIQVPNHPCIAVQSGDTGLSKGGTGDLLTGILAALLAQNLPMEQAIPLGVYIHGKASERVTLSWRHERSTLATDLAEFLPGVFGELEACPK